MMSSTGDIEMIIQLNDEQPFYSPGDRITGNLCLELSKDTAITKVAIVLSGRTKSKITQSNGQSTSTSRGRVQLFSQEKSLHNGHYTHKAGEFNWPFDFCIPESVDLSTLVNKWQPSEGFLTPTEDHIQIPLPPSFRFADSRASKGWHAMCTYTLEAIFIGAAHGKNIKSNTKQSTKRIYLLPSPPQPEPIDLEDPRHRRGFQTSLTVRSFRLLPECVSQLSIRQRTTTLLIPSKLPRFTFDIDISYPSIIQILHPSCIPLVVSASAKTDPASTTIQPNQRTFYRYPHVSFKHVRISLRASTECRTVSMLSEPRASATHDIPLVDRRLTDTYLSMRSMAWDQKNDMEEEAQTFIDFGKECNIFIGDDPRIGSDTLKDGDGPQSASNLQRLIAPSFTTHNISRRYHLVWSMDLECAGEKLTVRGVSAEEISVLAPPTSRIRETSLGSISWMVPPDDNDDSDDEQLPRAPFANESLPAYRELPDSQGWTSDEVRLQEKGGPR